MMGFSDSRQVRSALDRARDGLGLTAGAPLKPMELSVFLKYLLLEGLAVEEPLSWPRDGESRSGLRRRFEDLLDRLRLAPSTGDALSTALRFLEANLYYRSRVLDLAQEAVLSERLAPETCLCLEPMEVVAAMPLGGYRHAVVFAATAGFTHEFYPLAVDAYELDALRHGRSSIQLLGVHVDWLDNDGTIRRSILLDPERNRLLEADWDSPFQPDSVQFLCLGGRERTLHRDLAARFDCPQTNPYSPSELADDKVATLTGWTALGLEVPSFRQLEKGDWTATRRFIDEYPESVVKPKRGTEGLGVTYLSRSDPEMETKFFSALAFCWRRGEALIQDRRDGVLFRDPELGSLHTLALRLNLIYDGRRHRLSSGFAQIGADRHRSGSRGRGGRIVSLAEALSHLVARRGSLRPVDAPDRTMWADVVSQAERAAGLFDKLFLLGLDVLLDLDPGDRLVPVFLEANPRPAGLSHSRLLPGLPSGQDRAGVGLELWDGVEALYGDQAVPTPTLPHRNPLAMVDTP